MLACDFYPGHDNIDDDIIYNEWLKFEKLSRRDPYIVTESDIAFMRNLKEKVVQVIMVIKIFEENYVESYHSSEIEQAVGKFEKKAMKYFELMQEVYGQL